MNSKILAAPVVLATAAGLALATAAPAPARPGVADFGATQHLHDGGVTIAYTLEELEPSDDVVSNVALQGRLWEVSVTVEAVEGAATPVIPFFNARSADGQNYRALFTAVGEEALSGATLGQGQETEGNIYFDVTGAPPTEVVYNDAVQDRLIWR
ncbi:DUF1942 domain-containing protein [Mycolicibacterium thermoresistibile]|jgi:hypothetical protein|uniref:Immunogenic protein MPT63 n=2 Tax=Mycolicibacterium thermoresistibile TaxID=1797 RepID=G7CMZ1_MYCT3|nr:DUF1942 domain-containing protein [Mycolicibacterium thermoresistibile]EHI10480.1 immunogenic protein MPT63 [Mycolicibacterium thermoresistibile ATCC 19527]MCV7189619.1 MPT63 family protein [Mycolicibacterium thermoresistibile]GAT15468.1 immunogenic protein MPT63 [Mycolicibacterium thermoresistibile]SNW17527.1 FHA domain-containing protein [Mycolicibacterium thermoresistibile]